MFKTKKDVDRHVRTALSKLHSEHEKNLRGFTIAKLYYKINEYATAQHYVSAYLSVNESSAPAHKLLGQCLLQLKKPDSALESFQRSLNLDPKQSDLLIEVCNMLLADDSMLSNNKTKYWCDLAESENIQHNAVFSLRLKLLNKNNLETTQIEELIFKEIAARPTDPNLRVRIVKHFMEQNKITEAFRYAYDLEMNNHMLFLDCIDWYNIVWMATIKYRQVANTQTSWDYWLLSMICIERQVDLSFKNATNIASTNANIAHLLFTFDQHLSEAAKCVLELSPKKELGAQYLYHFRGQLCLHATALIFRRELVQNKNQWKEATKAALPLLLFAFHCGTPDTKESWLKHSGDKIRQVIQMWHREAAFRCAQAGRTLLSCFDSSRNNSLHGQVHNVISDQSIWSTSDELLTQIRQYCSDNTWRTKLFRILFPNSDQLVKIQSSHLTNCELLAEPTYELPKRSEIEAYEEIAQYLRPQSLQHMTYLCQGVENLTDVQCKYFNGLNFSTQNLAFCGAESLTRLDVETFLYATVIQAKRIYEIERQHYESYNAKNIGKPRILPFANMSTNLCTETQANWWQAAYQVYKNLGGDNLAELRATLQYGIEAVRGINGPKMDLIIILKLGKIFAARAQASTKSTERGFLDGRALALYKYGLTMLKLHTKGVLEPFRKLFKYSNANSSSVEQEINGLAEEAVTLIAGRHFKTGDYEECIEELAGIQLPYATYFQAEAYRKLDESNKTPRKTKKFYSDKAKDCLDQTIQLLGFLSDTNHPLKSVVQSEIKRLQYNNDSTANDRDDDDEMETRREIFNESFSPYRAQREPSVPLAKALEMENLIKQIMNTLSFVKDELVDRIKPEVSEIKQDISILREKVSTLEEAMKKRSEPPSRGDDGANVLDDLYIIGDDLQPVSLTQFNQQHQVQQQQQRMQTPNALLNQASMLSSAQLPPVANLYNSPLYNPMTGTLASQLLSQQTQYNNPAVAQSSYNTPHYNPSYPFNYYSQMMLPQMNLGLVPPPPQPPLIAQSDTTALYDILNLPSSATLTPGSDKPAQKPDNQAANTVPAMWKRLYNNAPVEKGPPVNVVITSSDPLPAHTTISTQSTLSVTIPPQHIKPSIVPTEFSQPAVPSFTMPPVSLSFGSNLGTVTTASITPSTASAPIFKPLVQQPAETVQLNKSTDSTASDTHNKSTESEYDPRPDFKPIIPLPDEVEVRTGEEDEEVLFCARAKLLRLIEKEWKERGIGDIKILKHKTDGRIRILMRREQTHKMCANHNITPEIKLTSAKADEKSLIWCADDYADEVVKREKLCVRFKQVETAREFKTAFAKAQEELKAHPATNTAVEEKKEPEKTVSMPFGLSKSNTFNFLKTTSTPKSDAKTTISKPDDKSAAPTTNTLFGTSKLSLNTNEPTKDPKAVEIPKPSPFANFTFSASTIAPKTDSPFANIFTKPSSQAAETQANAHVSPLTTKSGGDTKDANKSNASEGDEDEYVPTAQFQPVIPLPDLVEVETGEENEDVLFEHRAKLLRFDKTTGEWKERGIGVMKVLVDKNDTNRVRLLMRREQVLKLCCNQRLMKDTEFKYAQNSTNALTWVGPDFSEGVLQGEVLAIRFKTAGTCKDFHNVILKAQERMTAGEEGDVQGVTTQNNIAQDSIKSAAAGKTQPKKSAIVDKSDTQAKDAIGFGDKFKPKAGSWSCSACYTSNSADILYCVACEEPKDSTVPKKSPFGSINTANVTSKPAFTFGFGTTTSAPAATSITVAATKSTEQPKPVADFGDKFKPKAGAWSCQACYISNDANTLYCVACESQKDSTVAKKEPKSILAPASTSSKFQFGFAPAATTATTTTAVDLSKSATEISTDNPAAKPAETAGNPFDFGNKGGFVFGAAQPSGENVFAPTTNGSVPFSLSPGTMFGVVDTKATKSATKQLFDLLQKPPAIVDAVGSNFKLEKPEFSFTLKPKSPGKAKSPLKNTSGLEDDSDGEDVEEENNAYFAPVIPLPDKIDVVTGEEDEDELYCHRAKLYRFVSGEWKERGLGDIKILRHKQTNKLRVVMRREKVHKICLNHALTSEIEYKQKDEKSWNFVAIDFSEGEVQSTVFSIRFKNKDIADGFIDAVKKALSDTRLTTDGNEVVANTEADDLSGDVKKLADSLKLPYSFYKQDLKECSGCRGCDADSFVFPDYENISNADEDANVTNPIPLTMPQLCLQNKAVLKQSILAAATLTTPSDKSDTANIVSGQPIETPKSTKGDTAVDNFVFSLRNSKPQDALSKEPVFESGGFLFGNLKQTFGNSDKAKPIFGQTVFGSGDTEKTATTSIFGGANSSTSVFGTANNISSGGLFFGIKPTTNSTQESATVSTESNLFSSFSSKPKENEQQPPAFGAKTNFTFGSGFGVHTFGSSTMTTAGNIFGGKTFDEGTKKDSNANGDDKSINTFSNNENEASHEKDGAEEDATGLGSGEPLFKNDPGLSFASLAANASNQAGFQTNVDNNPPGGFIGLKQSNDFSIFLSSADAKNDSVNNTSQDGTGDDSNYDPHYEPAIELPELINLATGEENEEKLFGERAVLYRFDTSTKEWKERGTGEIKILYHPEKAISRVLMRREQIHKLVLNHAITDDFNMKPMNQNGKSFCWRSMNYAEENSEVESLAVRFKNVDIAKRFENEIAKCVEKAKQHGADLEED